MMAILEKFISRGTISFEKVQPIDVIGEGFAYLKNGYIATGMEVNWPGLFSLTETEIQNKVIGPIQHQCLNLPPGTVVTFQNFYKKKFVELGGDGDDDYLVRSQVRMYEEKWQKKYHKSYLFISYPSHYTVSDWVVYDEESFKRADRKKGKKLNKVIVREKIENTANIAKVLNDTGVLKCKVMNELAIRTYARDYTFVSHFDKPVPGMIRDSENFLSIGNKRLVTIGLAGKKDSVVEDLTYPEYTTDFTKPSTSGKKTGMPASFVHALGLGLDIDHNLTLGFVVHDDVNMKKKVYQHMKNLEGIGNKFDNNLNKSVFTKGFIEGIQQDNADRLVSYYMNVQVFDEDAERLSEKVKLSVQAFESVGLSAVVENFLNLDIFLGGLCGNGYTFPRQFLSSVKRVVRLFPYESHGVFSDKGILVTSLSGSPGYLDFISRDTFLGNRKVKKTNFNITMFGKTGSGKSNMIGYMVMYLLQLRAHMILIDKGNSFGKLTKILAGLIQTKLYIYSEDNPLAFNPFLIERKGGKYNTASEEKIFLVNLLLGSIERGFEESEIEQLKDLFTDFILVEYYDRVNKGMIKSVKFNSFYEFLRQYITELGKKKDGVTDDERLIIRNFPTDKVLIGLKKYYEGGSYSHLFNAEENYDVVDDQLIVFELDRIQSDPFLYRVVSMCISQIAEQKLKHGKLQNVLKFLGIDEGTFVLNSFLAEFFTGYYQTARKHGGGILFTDQTIDKLVETGKANRILGNSDTVIILEQKWTKQTLDYMRDYLEFTDEYIRKARAIDNTGNWRQGVIKMNEVIENFQVNFSEEFFLALNTDADNQANQRLMELLSTFANFKYAIKQTMADQKKAQV